jgi:hypothetical protein
VAIIGRTEDIRMLPVRVCNTSEYQWRRNRGVGGFSPPTEVKVGGAKWGGGPKNFVFSGKILIIKEKFRVFLETLILVQG